MTTVQPLTEEELQRLAELQELQKRQEAYEKQQAQKEAKAERDKFNAKCKAVFGLSKKQIEERLQAEAPAPAHDYWSEYYELKQLVDRLKTAWNKGDDWSFADYVARAEAKANEKAFS